MRFHPGVGEFAHLNAVAADVAEYAAFNQIIARAGWKSMPAEAMCSKLATLESKMIRVAHGNTRRWPAKPGLIVQSRWSAVPLGFSRYASSMNMPA